MFKWLLLILPLVGGMAGGMQAPVNGALGKRVGAFEAAAVSFSVGVTVAWLAKLLFGQGRIAAIAEVPAWQLIGGLLGMCYVTTVLVAVPRTGAAAAVFAGICGQLVFTVAADHFGWLGLTRIPFGPGRALGLALVVAGVLLVFRSQPA